MIVRIMGEGSSGSTTATATTSTRSTTPPSPPRRAGDETAFLTTFAALLDHVREVGTPLADDALEGSDVLFPPADTTFAEAQHEFTGDGLIPD
jgi:hypothetical protein